MPDKSTVRVAVTQHEPEWLDLQKSVEKTCKIIEEAAAGGAELVTFAEAFIPGYPAWIWTRPLDPMLSTQYIQNSLAVDSDEMRKIQDCAARNKIVVSLGFSENDNNSVYIAQALIDSDGAMLMNRRKLKATHMERTIFGDASGDSLLNVSKTSIGRKVGTLACWEHAQPLLKFNTISQKEEIHCAAWPPIVPHQGGPDLWSLSKEGCQSLSQVYAIESQTFVLHATTVITEKGIETMSTEAGLLMNSPGGGASAIFGPDGRLLTAPLDSATEGLIFADLDFTAAIFAKSFLDICGHYSRPDLLWLGRDTKKKLPRVDSGN
ncbi:carbon-nitrogen hydrolase [Aureobasidium pullulans]|uniref:nitrilase n=1 Tax=Aureobasidium pullulans TaxID=5580 RepID=A0A4S9E7F5_AURPU|nr:carbon-nitrogen hydrolase [Aureobasidium pullulans]THX33463.1 carbon-nitrogen hydrolase [Aureobasidium pullulans]THY54550.1 carbon-nitrogen hydrolase [Aureobasidium pullulans]